MSGAAQVVIFEMFGAFVGNVPFAREKDVVCLDQAVDAAGIQTVQRLIGLVDAVIFDQAVLGFVGLVDTGEVQVPPVMHEADVFAPGRILPRPIKRGQFAIGVVLGRDVFARGVRTNPLARDRAVIERPFLAAGADVNLNEIRVRERLRRLVLHDIDGERSHLSRSSDIRCAFIARHLRAAKFNGHSFNLPSFNAGPHV